MSGWTAENLAAHYARLRQGVPEPLVPDAPKRPSKYGARKKEVDGHVFDSSREAARYIELKAMQAAGVIRDLELQPRFVLQEGMTDCGGKRIRKIEYAADFMYRIVSKDMTNGWVQIEDVKGFRTPVFSLKEKLFRAKYPHLRLEIIK